MGMVSFRVRTVFKKGEGERRRSEMRGGRGIERLRRAVKLRGRPGRLRDEMRKQRKEGETPREAKQTRPASLIGCNPICRNGWRKKERDFRERGRRFRVARPH